MAQTTTLLEAAITPNPVKSHPFPIAVIRGWAIIPPTQENRFLIKLLTATPDDDFRGMNSVSIVVAIEKMSILPRPKKKPEASCQNLISTFIGYTVLSDDAYRNDPEDALFGGPSIPYLYTMLLEVEAGQCT